MNRPGVMLLVLIASLQFGHPAFSAVKRSAVTGMIESITAESAQNETRVWVNNDEPEPVLKQSTILTIAKQQTNLLIPLIKFRPLRYMGSDSSQILQS